MRRFILAFAAIFTIFSVNVASKSANAHFLRGNFLSTDSSAFFVMAGMQGDVTYVSVSAQEDPRVSGAHNFVEKLGNKAMEFAKNGKNLSKSNQESQFRKLLISHFDMKTIGRFSLGRYWRQADKSQQKEYLKLFEDMVVKIYTGRFNSYSGQKFVVKNGRTDGKRDVLINSAILQGNGPEIKIDWRVREKNGQYSIVDVSVEGVSMAVTQRSDFSSVIQRGGGNIDALLEHLRANN